MTKLEHAKEMGKALNEKYLPDQRIEPKEGVQRIRSVTGGGPSVKP